MALTDSLTDVVRHVRAALDGGPAYAPQPRLSDAQLPDGTALVLRTSGSTGDPREVALSAAALRAGAQATHDRLGGKGAWLLVLPPTHVAGVQVITRSLVAGTDVYPGSLDHFTAQGFAELAAGFAAVNGDDVRRYVSLVPTQLHRLVTAADGGERAGLEALARFDAVLVGGAATPPSLLAAARAAGVRAVTTYGMSETSGGCVYDGVQLPGVRVRLDGSATDDGETSAQGTGVIELAGPVLATGYVGDPAATADAFRTDPDGTRWFRTSDLGRFDEGRLTVVGRADDVILTGGVNVAPAAVEEVVTEYLAAAGTPGEVCVVGVPDDEWGQAVVGVVALPGLLGPGAVDDAALLAGVRAAVGRRLGTAAAPRRVYVTAELPSRGPGKVDRRAVRDAVVRSERNPDREPVRP